MLLSSNSSSAPRSDASSAGLRAGEPVAVHAPVIDALLEIDPHGAEHRQMAAPIVARVDVLGGDLDRIAPGNVVHGVLPCAYARRSIDVSRAQRSVRSEVVRCRLGSSRFRANRAELCTAPISGHRFALHRVQCECHGIGTSPTSFGTL